jgi:hypothetical protein
LREAKNQKSHNRERNENFQQGEAGLPWPPKGPMAN